MALNAKFTETSMKACLRAADQLLRLGSYDEAIELLRPAANVGSAEAMYLMATAYWSLPATRESLDGYTTCLRQAAELGHSLSLLELGLWLNHDSDYGDETRQGHKRPDSLESEVVLRKAFEALEAASIRGDAKSRYYLGMCYKLGLGIPQDGQQAQVCFAEAQEQGFEISGNCDRGLLPL